MSKKQKLSDGDIAKVVLDDLDRFEHFAVTNWRGIIIACVSIVVFVAVFAITINVRSSISEKAAAEIAAASSIDDLEKVVEKHAGGPAANSARMRLATMLASVGKNEKALEQFRVVAESKDVTDEMRWRARLNSCYLLELLGKKAEAAEGFSEVGSNTLVPDLYRSEANYGAGRLFLALDKPEKAAAAFKTASGEGAQFLGVQSFWAGQSKLMLDNIPAAKPAPEAKKN